MISNKICEAFKMIGAYGNTLDIPSLLKLWCSKCCLVDVC